MLPLPSRTPKTLTSRPWRLRLIELVSLLVVIVTLLSVAHGLMTLKSMALIPAWCLMGVTTLLILTIALNFTRLIRLIRMWMRSSSGGKQTYTPPYKN